MELEEVVRRGSPEVQARRTAREDWEAGTDADPQKKGELL